MKTIIRGVLGLWFLIVFLLGAVGGFVRTPGTPPFPILIGSVGPVILFIVAYLLSASFRTFILSIDLPVATAIQAWRFAGLGFLALYTYGILPGVFAWPAGLGDIAIGVTAPWVVFALLRRSGFATSRVFVVWNLFGILDLINAISTGGLNSALASGIPGEVTTGPMAQLPLVLIPAYFVPLFLMLHLAALFQAKRQKSAGYSVMI